MPLSLEKKLQIKSDILANGYKVWPKPKEGNPYGPTAIQAQGFNIPHKHFLDVVLIYGGTRSGKTIASVAAGLNYMIRYPGIEIMLGCQEYEHLKRTAITEYRKMLSVETEWDHPLITGWGPKDIKGGKPTNQDKTIRLINRSMAYCVHFSDFTILRGSTLGFAHIEEASLIKDASIFKEIIRRMSSPLAPQKQIFITSNPEESRGWLYETFKLKQFEEDYNGPPIPIAPPCNCQFCQVCLSKEDPEEVLIPEDKICPKCKTRKDNNCPGNQDWMRVIFTDQRDNVHVDQAYFQAQKLAASSEIEFNLYTKGKVVELKQERPYKSFSRENILKEDITLDYTKDMYWSHDFNVSRQSSVIVQEEGDNAIVIDEIILPYAKKPWPKAGPDDVAIEWLQRYHDYNGVVNLIFDPAAFNHSITKDDGGVKVKMIRERLENPEKYRFLEEDVHKLHPLFPECKPKRVVELTRKIEGKTKVMVSARIDSTNALLNTNGHIRLKLNPKCQWTITSLDSVKWKEGSVKPTLDGGVDKADVKNPDKSTVRTVTHPADALSYYVYKRFPVVDVKYTEMYAYLPGAGLIKTSKDGKKVLTNLDPTPSEEQKQQEREKELNIVHNMEKKREWSLMGLLVEGGGFEEFHNPLGDYWI